MAPNRHFSPGVLDVLGLRVEEQVPAPLDQVVVDCAVYLDGVRLPGNDDYAAALRHVRQLNEGRSDEDDGRAFVWLGLREPAEHHMAAVAKTFGLHPIPVEDAVHAQQRPKVERYDDTLFVVVKTVHYVPHESVDEARRIAETGEVMVFVGDDFVVAVRHGNHSGLACVRARPPRDR